MRLPIVSAAAVLLMLTASSRAEDDLRPVIEKAVKAMGGAEKLGKYQGGKIKTKATLELLGGISMTQQITSHASGKYKEVDELEVSGQNFTVVVVFDGKQGWMSLNGTAKEADGKLLEELKEASHLIRIMRLTSILDDKDKTFTLSPLGEAKVEGKEVIGVQVASKGHRDVNLYFDKKTGLVVKVERRAYDVQNEKEFTEERIIKDYVEVEGMKVPKKVLVNRDGKKFMEAEVEKTEVLESIDKDEFAKP